MLPAWSQSVLYHKKFTYGCELHDELSFHRIRESDGHVAGYNARHRGDGSPANGYAMSARSISRAFVALRNDAWHSNVVILCRLHNGWNIRMEKRSCRRARGPWGFKNPFQEPQTEHSNGNSSER